MPSSGARPASEEWLGKHDDRCLHCSTSGGRPLILCFSCQRVSHRECETVLGSDASFPEFWQCCKCTSEEVEKQERRIAAAGALAGVQPNTHKQLPQPVAPQLVEIVFLADGKKKCPWCGKACGGGVKICSGCLTPYPNEEFGEKLQVRAIKQKFEFQCTQRQLLQFYITHNKSVATSSHISLSDFCDNLLEDYPVEDIASSLRQNYGGALPHLWERFMRPAAAIAGAIAGAGAGIAGASQAQDVITLANLMHIFFREHGMQVKRREKGLLFATPACASSSYRFTNSY